MIQVQEMLLHDLIAVGLEGGGVTCVTCHMGEAYGAQAGGHTWKMSYEYHGHDVPNVDGCITCHPELKDDPTFDRNKYISAEFQPLYDEARDALIAAGVLNADGEHAIAGTYSGKLASAFWNFKLVQEDRSKGLHNPQFAKALLQAAIDGTK